MVIQKSFNGTVFVKSDVDVVKMQPNDCNQSNVVATNGIYEFNANNFENFPPEIMKQYSYTNAVKRYKSKSYENYNIISLKNLPLIALEIDIVHWPITMTICIRNSNVIYEISGFGELYVDGTINKLNCCGKAIGKLKRHVNKKAN